MRRAPDDHERVNTRRNVLPDAHATSASERRKMSILPDEPSQNTHTKGSEMTNMINSQFNVLIEISASADLACQVREAVAYLRSEPTLDLEADEFAHDFPFVGRHLAGRVIDVDLLDTIKEWLETYTPIRWRHALPTLWTSELAA